MRALTTFSNHLSLGLSLGLLLGLPLTACLTEGTRQGLGDTAGDTQTGDTSGDTTADTSADTSSDTSSDTSDPCENKVCDDNDECTYDYCDPSTGECAFIGMPSTPEPAPGGAEAPSGAAMPVEPCVGGCDDQDQCTKDECIYVPDGCGLQGFYTCVHAPVEDCGGCAQGCDDGDACTTDECLGDTCVSTPIEGCLAGCTAQGTVSISEVIQGVYAADTKTVGVLGAYPNLQSCNDGPDCGCIGYPGLADESANLALSAPTDVTQDTWQCSTTGCGVTTTTCEPVQAGVRYRVWGRTIADFDLGYNGFVPPAPDPEDPGAVPPVRIAGIAVADYCLETVAASLVGQYNGTWEIGASVAAFKATISADVAPKITFSQLQCTDQTCPLDVREFTAPLTVGDGWVEVSAQNMPVPLGGDLALRLYSKRNTLTGSYGQPNFAGEAPSDFIAPPPGGVITLDRQAPIRATTTP